jgi:TPR repeat protein
MFIYATQNGIDYLQYLIGSCYETGMYDFDRDKYAFDINYTRATEWYLAASNNGDSRADYRLGMMYEYGKVVDKSLDKAIHYYEMAS